MSLTKMLKQSPSYQSQKWHEKFSQTLATDNRHAALHTELKWEQEAEESSRMRTHLVVLFNL